MKKNVKDVEARKSRILARGETSNHCHAIVGNATIAKVGKNVFVNVEDSTAVLRHLIETKYVNDAEEIWTKEHNDVPLSKIRVGERVRQGDVMLEKVNSKKFKYIAQQELDMNTLETRNVYD